MKKFTLNFKTLLVAAGLVLGSVSAWAAETWDFTNSTTWGSVTLPSAETPTYYYTTAGEASTSTPGSSYITIYSSTGKIVHANDATNGLGFSAIGSTSDDYVKISVPAGKTVSVTGYVSGNRNLQVSFNGNTTTFSGSWADVTKDFINSTENALDLYIYCSANYGEAESAPFLKSISLKTTFAVTTHYQDEVGNTIKEDLVENVETGTLYSSDYTTPYYVSDTDPYTYTYESGAASGVTITEAKEYTIVYTKSDRSTHTFTVKQSYGGKEETLLDAVTVYDNASYTYYYPKYIKDGNTLYEYTSSTDGNASKSYWCSSQTVTGDKSYTLTYNAVSGVCAYYMEGEDIDGATEYARATYKGRSSDGSTGVLSSATLTTLNAGNYSITARAIGKGKETVGAYKTSIEGTNILSITTSTSGADGTGNFSLDATTPIVANGGNDTDSDNGYGWDYIYIMVTNVTATIGAKGYTTFSSSYPLDLASLPDGLTAYYVESSNIDKGNKIVTLTQATGAVAAGTGLLLKGTASTSYNIPVAASGTPISGNKMVGCPTATEITKDTKNSGNFYVLVNGSSSSEFQNVATYLTSNNLTIPAGKAYLDATGVEGAGILNIVFEGEATGITTPEVAEPVEDGVMYNLSGQIVSSDYKGIVIKNGKKYLNK